MKYIARITIRTFTLLVLAGLAASAALAQKDELGGTKWQLTHINGTAVSTDKAFLEFDLKEDRFSGNAGCNRMFGTVDVTGRLIDFGPVGTTKMACTDQASNRVERSFTANLNNVKRYRKTGSTLEMLNGGRTILKFKGHKGEADTLDSKRWIVEQIGGKPVRAKGEQPFLVFDAAKSSAGGNTGCNVFGGNYESKGKTIRIFDTVSTMRACIEDERMAVERHFMDALQKANRFEIKGEKLFLYHGAKLLITFAGRGK